ncbi:hypothetical protein [Spirosoma sordidisoli]|uniref:TonB C-terminal domain-containing protein n=1 Tax=Spirosoma sordidisoli TaxID=2502893 RepID=A0A4Q2UGM8_9BACT|nr:hypothetical protein [Spirosoma sordidisoli]RYC66575.1 hypothetical protein EQG79_28690 [Spirosoma sordidisoli]
MKYFLLWLLLVAVISSTRGQVNQSALINNPDFGRAVAKSVRFPAVAQRLGKSIRVYVGFTLTDKGGYQDIAVINQNPIDESLKLEVDRLWHVLPDQNPKCAGNYVIPISFMLGEGGPNKLKQISNQDDKFIKQGDYTLLKEVSVIGYIECELRSLSN